MDFLIIERILRELETVIGINPWEMQIQSFFSSCTLLLWIEIFLNINKSMMCDDD